MRGLDHFVFVWWTAALHYSEAPEPAERHAMHRAVAGGAWERQLPAEARAAFRRFLDERSLRAQLDSQRAFLGWTRALVNHLRAEARLAPLSYEELMREYAALEQPGDSLVHQWWAARYYWAWTLLAVLALALALGGLAQVRGAAAQWIQWAAGGGAAGGGVARRRG